MRKLNQLTRKDTMQTTLPLEKTRKIKLRTYQVSVKEKVLFFLEKKRNTILYLPTGGGKTEVAASIVLDYLQNDKKTVFVVNRIDLVVQLKKRLALYGIDAGTVWQKQKLDCSKLVQIVSIDSLKMNSLAFLKTFDPDLIIIDEVHNHINKRAYPLYQLFQNKGIFLGLSATPWLTGKFDKNDNWDEFWLDNPSKPIWRNCEIPSVTGTIVYKNFFFKSLGYVFDEIVSEVSANTLKELGYLVPVDVYVYDETKNLHRTLKVDTDLGDFSAIEMERVLMDQKLLNHIVGEYLLRGKNEDGTFKRGIIFPSGVNHSLKICESFKKKGITAIHIDGTTPSKTRQEIYRQLELNQINLISSCDCFSEGFDLPAIEIALHCRPTKSLARYVQQIGRVLRISPSTNKEKAIILDQGDNSRSILSPVTQGCGFHPYDHLLLDRDKILKIEEPGLPKELIEDEEVDELKLDKKIKTVSSVELSAGQLLAPRTVRKTRELIQAYKQGKILTEVKLINLFLFNVELPSCQAVEELGLALGKDIQWMEKIYSESQFIFYSCQGLKVSNFNCSAERLTAIKKDLSVFYRKIENLLKRFSITPDFNPPNNNFFEQLNQARLKDPKAAFGLYRTLLLGLSIPNANSYISAENRSKISSLNKAWDFLNKKYKKVQDTLITLI